MLYCLVNLLIVPYGIETPCCEVQRIQPGLLIVPYGIETAYRYGDNNTLPQLLIVPYGIETADQRNNSEGDCLLIVPYGIETWERSNPSTFNVDF